MNSGIYQIRNLINNKVYIGSSNNFNRRKRKHFLELNRNKHVNKRLQNAYNKYGSKNFIFEIVEEVNINRYKTDKEIRKYLCFIEQHYLDIISKEQKYNISDKTDGGYQGKGKKIVEFTKYRYVTIFDSKMNFIEEIKGVTETSKKYNLSGHTIHRCCKGLIKVENYIFKYSDRLDINYVFRDRKQAKNSKTIYVYDLNGNYITEYRNCLQASKHTGVSRNSILSDITNTEKINKRKYKYIFSYLKPTNMSCGVTKCKNPSCNVKMKACKLKSGYCPTCYSQQFPNSSQKTCKL